RRRLRAVEQVNLALHHRDVAERGERLEERAERAEMLAQLELDAVVVGALRVGVEHEARATASRAVHALDGEIELLREQRDAHDLARARVELPAGVQVRDARPR